MTTTIAILLSAVALASLPTATAQGGAIIRVGSSRTIQTLVQAVAIAQPSDVLLVDAETFGPFEIIGKSISVIAASGAAVPFRVRHDPGRPALRIRQIGTGQSVTIIGLSTGQEHGDAPAVEVLDCLGSVRMHSITCEPRRNIVDARCQSVFVARRVRSLWLSTLTIWPSSPRSGRTIVTAPSPLAYHDGLCALLLEDCTANLDFIRVRGYDNRGPQPQGAFGGDAIRLIGSSTHWLTNTIGGAAAVLEGGVGGDYGGSAIHLVQSMPQEKIEGCGTTLLSPGRGASSRGGFFEVNGDRGLVLVTPNLTIERFLPMCLAEALGHISIQNPVVSIGSSFDLQLYALFPRNYTIFLGPSQVQGRLPIPGVEGRPMLDYFAPSTFPLLTGALTSTLLATHRFTMPKVPGLIGLQFATQAVLGPPRGQAQPPASLSRAALFVVR